MDEKLYKELRNITDEEKEILQGRDNIDRRLYMALAFFSSVSPCASASMAMAISLVLVYSLPPKVDVYKRQVL